MAHDRRRKILYISDKRRKDLLAGCLSAERYGKDTQCQTMWKAVIDRMIFTLMTYVYEHLIRNRKQTTPGKQISRKFSTVYTVSDWFG